MKTRITQAGKILQNVAKEEIVIMSRFKNTIGSALEKTKQVLGEGYIKKYTMKNVSNLDLVFNGMHTISAPDYNWPLAFYESPFNRVQRIEQAAEHLLALGVNTDKVFRSISVLGTGLVLKDVMYYALEGDDYNTLSTLVGSAGAVMFGVGGAAACGVFGGVAAFGCGFAGGVKGYSLGQDLNDRVTWPLYQKYTHGRTALSLSSAANGMYFIATGQPYIPKQLRK